MKKALAGAAVFSLVFFAFASKARAGSIFDIFSAPLSQSVFDFADIFSGGNAGNGNAVNNPAPAPALAAPAAGVSHVVDQQLNIALRLDPDTDLTRTVNAGAIEYSTADGTYLASYDPASKLLEVPLENGGIQYFASSPAAGSPFSPVQPDHNGNIWGNGWVINTNGTLENDPVTGLTKMISPDGGVDWYKGGTVGGNKLDPYIKVSVEQDPDTGAIKVTEPDGTVRDFPADAAKNIPAVAGAPPADAVPGPLDSIIAQEIARQDAADSRDGSSAVYQGNVPLSGGVLDPVANTYTTDNQIFPDGNAKNSVMITSVHSLDPEKDGTYKTESYADKELYAVGYRNPANDINTTVYADGNKVVENNTQALVNGGILYDKSDGSIIGIGGATAGGNGELVPQIAIGPDGLSAEADKDGNRVYASGNIDLGKPYSAAAPAYISVLAPEKDESGNAKRDAEGNPLYSVPIEAAPEDASNLKDVYLDGGLYQKAPWVDVKTEPFAPAGQSPVSFQGKESQLFGFADSGGSGSDSAGSFSSQETSASAPDSYSSLFSDSVSGSADSVAGSSLYSDAFSYPGFNAGLGYSSAQISDSPALWNVSPESSGSSGAFSDPYASQDFYYPSQISSQFPSQSDGTSRTSNESGSQLFRWDLLSANGQSGEEAPGFPAYDIGSLIGSNPLDSFDSPQFTAPDSNRSGLENPLFFNYQAEPQNINGVPIEAAGGGQDGSYSFGAQDGLGDFSGDNSSYYSQETGSGAFDPAPAQSGYYGSGGYDYSGNAGYCSADGSDC